MRKALAGIAMTMLGVVGLAGTAFAAPAPPEPDQVASDLLGSLVSELLDVVTSLATNPWVLSIFGISIAFGIVARVINKGKSANPVGKS